MRKLIIFLSLLITNLYAQTPLVVPYLQQGHTLNNSVFSKYRLNKPYDIYNNTVSFHKPPNMYYDGDYNTPYNPRGGVYYPCETFVELGGTYEVSHLRVFDKGGGSTFTIKSGPNIFNLTLDTVLTMNTGLVRTVNMKKKNIKFFSWTLNTGNGPSEVEIYSTPITKDVIPPLVLRPLVKLEDMTGWNGDIPTTEVIQYAKANVRQYDHANKMVIKKGANIFGFQPGYIQGFPYDDRYAQITAAGKVSNPLFFNCLGEDSIFRPAYDSLGFPWNGAYRMVLPWKNRRIASSWSELSRFGYQYAARYGSVAVPLSNTRLEPNNTVKTGLNLIKEAEFGNEEDRWWLGDTNTFSTPPEAYAKASAIYDGDEGRMGLRHGVKQADPNFLVIQDALGDFNYGYNKIIYHYAKHFRTDGKFPFDATNYHSYLSKQGGQHNLDDKGIAPELYQRPGYKAFGAEEYFLEHGQFDLRYLPGVQRRYSEFGYDSNKESSLGVPMPTEAEAQTKPIRFSDQEVQGSLLQRSLFAIMKSRCFDRIHIYTYFDYDVYHRALPDYASDTRNPNNPIGVYDQFYTAQQFSTSGIVNGQFHWALGKTNAPIDLTTITGQTVTFKFAKDRAYYLFPTGTGALQIRYPAEGFQGPGQTYQYQDNKMFGTVLSQNDSVVVVKITSAQLSSHGVSFQRNNVSEWRFDTPYAPKHSKHMFDNMFDVMHDCWFLADSSKNGIKDYRFTNSAGRIVAAVWLPSQTWEQANNIQINVGNPTTVYERKNHSRTNVTTTKTITAGKITTTVNEMPKFFYWGGGNVQANIDPVANAGADKSIITNSTTLTGAGTDADGTIISYNWVKLTGGASTMSGVASANLNLSNLVNGSYSFRLTVTDNQGATATDDVNLIVNIPSGNQAPVAYGGNATITTSSVTLYGDATDSDGTIASRLWSQISGPGAGIFSSTTAYSVVISNLVNGTYQFRCTVTDNGGATGFATFNVNVSGVGTTNIPPTAIVESSKTITTTSTTLSGSGTDSDGTITGFAWTKLSGGAATITNANTAIVSLSGLVNGIYVFRLTVTDNGNATSNAELTLTVNTNSGGTSAAYFTTDTDIPMVLGANTYNTPTLIYYPAGYAEGSNFPVIVFAGGMGEKWNGNLTRQQNMDYMRTHTLPKALNNGMAVPAVVVCPMITNADWNFGNFGDYYPGLPAQRIASWAKANLKVDPQRVSITGLSLGGNGIFNTLIEYPNTWSAAIVVNANQGAGPQLANINCPVHYVTSDNDSQSNIDGVTSCIDQINGYGNVGFPCKYTVWSAIGHSGWDQLYDNTANSLFTLSTDSRLVNNVLAPNPWYTWMIQYKLVNGQAQLVNP